MSRLIDHAHRELELLAPDPNEDADYGPSWLKSAVMPIIGVFAASGHSGGSAAMVLPLIQKLLQGENLTPITDEPHDWQDMTANGNPLMPMWQCRRNSKFMSGDAGRTYWNVDEQTGDGSIRAFHISDSSKQPVEFYHQDPTYGFNDPCPLEEVYYGPGGFWNVIKAPGAQWNAGLDGAFKTPSALQDWHIAPDNVNCFLQTRETDYVLTRPTHLIGQTFPGIEGTMPAYTFVVDEKALRHFFRRVRNARQTDTGYNIPGEMNPGLGQFINAIQTPR